MNTFDQLILVLASLLANLFSAFSGGGAGLIQLPLLLFLGLPFSLALATHKVATVALGVGASLKYGKRGNLEKQIVLIMVLSGVPGVMLGAYLIVHIPELVARRALGGLMLGLGLYSVFKPTFGQEYVAKNRDYRGLMIGATGLFMMAILNGSLTSGTGLLVTLWLIRWFGMDYLTAVAHTLVLVGLLWNGTGAVTLGMISEIYWLWLPALLLGSVLGGYLGAHLAIEKGSAWIKRGFEVVTLLIGIKLLLG